MQAAAGFLSQIEGLPDVTAAPFHFPARYRQALELVSKQVRSFTTTSVGRLFDSAAALLGFTRGITFEGQAAMWVESLARQTTVSEPYPFPFIEGHLDFRPLLLAVAEDRKRGRSTVGIARGFQIAVARGLTEAATELCREHQLSTIVLSGGVFQNELLLSDIRDLLSKSGLDIWTNQVVPPNDGGISLGQAALVAFSALVPAT